LEWGRFYGTPNAFLVDGQEVATEPAQVWAEFNKVHEGVGRRGRERYHLQKYDLGAIREKENLARKAYEEVERKHGKNAPESKAAAKRFAEVQEWARAASAPIEQKIQDLDQENNRYQMRLTTADGQSKTLALADIVRAYPANQFGFGDKLGITFA